MFLSAADAPFGCPLGQTGSQIAALGPDGNLHPISVDAQGNVYVNLAGGATAANQATEIARLGTIATNLGGTLTVATEGVAAAKAGTAFRATTGLVTVAPASAVGAVLPTTPVAVALFQNPSAATKTVTLDVRALAANASGYFVMTRDPTVTAPGSGAITPVNLLASATTTPGATLYQAGGSTALAASGGKPEATVIMGTNGTDRDLVAGREILPPGHALLISFLPFQLLAIPIVATAGFDWREA